MDFENADYGMPGCSYERTHDGFLVTFRGIWTPLYFVLLLVTGLVSLLGIIVLAFSLHVDSGAAGALLFFVPSLTVIVWMIWRYYTNPIVIEVTREAVMIGDKKLRRADFHRFGQFEGALGVGRQTTQVGRMSYTYGNQEFFFGPLKDPYWVTRTVAALNIRMNALRGAATDSPEQLRSAARPTDF